MKKSLGILHIDDDEDDGFLFHSALKEIDNSITYIFYQDAQKALKDLKSFTLNPDYIFLDLNMPKMNGIEALGALKAMKRLSNIPIIICSTSSKRPDPPEYTYRIGVRPHELYQHPKSDSGSYTAYPATPISKRERLEYPRP